MFLYSFFNPLGKEPGLFDMVIVNDDLEEAYDKLKSALMEVSSCLGIFMNSSDSAHSVYLKLGSLYWESYFVM